MTARSVLIVGAGPAGASLAYLLARRGIRVTILEKHPDFTRAFRGEGLQPSGIEAFAQMGLSQQLARLPQAIVDNLHLYRNGVLQAGIPTEKVGFVGRFVSQPAMLQMLTDESTRYPTFRLKMGVTARELIRENDRVVGLRVDGPDGTRDVRADLVIGTDGRHSITRKQGHFTELETRQGFDVLWAKLPLPDFWPNRTARMELGNGCFAAAFPSSDGCLQIGFSIPKGGFKHLRSLGVEAWTEELIARLSPQLAGHLRAHRDTVGKAILLDVVVGRLTRWTSPGLLLLGDAAHPTSPVGGQGINLALRDVLVAANRLVPVLRGGADVAAVDAASESIAAERMPEIVAMQEHQDRQAKAFLAPNWMYRQALRMLPILANVGLLRVMMWRRMEAMKHGVLPVNLAV